MDERTKMYDYLADVRGAKIDGGAKGLLYFYATVYNWSKNTSSFYSERSICASVGISLSTYQKRRTYLESFGWIKTTRRGTRGSVHVAVQKGFDDPSYANKCWANWHPSNKMDDPDEKLSNPQKDKASSQNENVWDQW